MPSNYSSTISTFLQGWLGYQNKSLRISKDLMPSLFPKTLQHRNGPAAFSSDKQLRFRGLSWKPPKKNRWRLSPWRRVSVKGCTQQPRVIPVDVIWKVWGLPGYLQISALQIQHWRIFSQSSSKSSSESAASSVKLWELAAVPRVCVLLSQRSVLTVWLISVPLALTEKRLKVLPMGIKTVWLHWVSPALRLRSWMEFSMKLELISPALLPPMTFPYTTLPLLITVSASDLNISKSPGAGPEDRRSRQQPPPVWMGKKLPWVNNGISTTQPQLVIAGFMVATNSMQQPNQPSWKSKGTPRISTRFPASGRGCKKKRSHSPPPTHPKKMSKKSLKQIPNGCFFPNSRMLWGLCTI